MKDEIKEILDNLIINETTGMCYLSIRLTNQIRIILTNLQQENEELKQIIEGNNCCIQNLKKDFNDYKSRCEKSLHLIKHNDIYDYRVFEEKLENILNGE